MDQFYMKRALGLAARAQGRTSPNPMVGAVIVKNGQLIGEGYHHQAGTPHAEVHALNEAGEQAVGATLYVTLEPCSHFGRTPPCADAVIKAGIKRVVIATTDPNPQVAGKGIARLKDAGIEVELGVMEHEASRLNEVFFKYIQTGLPFVALKTAMTLDGKIASYSGDSKWITGEDARHYVHQLRNIYDAIMVGIGTVLKDDPFLNTRLEIADMRNPVRIIIDSNLDLPPTSNIARSSHEQRTLVFCSSNSDSQRREPLEALGVELISLDIDSDLIPLEKVLGILGEMGLCSLLVEGGGEINAYLLEHQLLDKAYWFIAPKIIGGRQAPSPIGGQGIEFMKDALELKSMEIQKFSEDFLLTGYFKEWC
ncbi:MAG: bifunctional diaminohydroxyphosphoribosylaminopyrimidine deaminase/5-amino-6-(5-phosphoribosylamino)uracil reductase RibD [Syntrophomonas sp.]|nr:bifunctional diaminohydroxyphosphoribosylaminopyrimidine deaminase/5-amino-6-(5-phosphoribosylamino)uracil reductase RibD [Syntrophomonas sp.]